MSDFAHRLARLDRAQEHERAYQLVERLLKWATATGRLEAHKADSVRRELQDHAPFDVFVAGRWEPPARSTDNPEACTAMVAEMERWERLSGLAP